MKTFTSPADSPFVRAMKAALANRGEAKTSAEREEADQFLRAIMEANRRGQDVSVFIPRETLRSVQPLDARAHLGDGDSAAREVGAPPALTAEDKLFEVPFEEPGRVLPFDSRMAAAGKDED